MSEIKRLKDSAAGNACWRKWGPYLSERQWGTVREDYSDNGDAWGYLPYDHARSKSYRWGEDGIAGISDDQQRLCFSVAMWNGQDDHLKERLFGLSGPEGNHAEDVKEYYYYLDSLPSHAYMKMLYKYPHSPFPYQELRQSASLLGYEDPEYELIDTGIFNDDRYFDVFVEYAKAGVDDILVRITAENRAADSAEIYLLPQIWFRNTWSWQTGAERPSLGAAGDSLAIEHATLGKMNLHYQGSPQLLFCENDSNVNRLYGLAREGYFKDGINRYLVDGEKNAVNPALKGTRAALCYHFQVEAGQSAQVELRLSSRNMKTPFADAPKIFEKRLKETDAFYQDIQQGIGDPDARRIQRQAFAGMLWGKQFYYYNVSEWLKGDPGHPAPPAARLKGRNHHWGHLKNYDIVSMPDKWEYPWYAAWDSAFHAIPLALIDPEFAKEQILLFTRDWYMHPNGQLPAYEWAFDDVNPPVHAWAAWRVYKIDAKRNNGKADLDFLTQVFHRLLLNFTWWVNRKDEEGDNVFQGGFLGLDNIGVFNRSEELPTGGHIDQADGTSWMAMYCLNMMRIAIEISLQRPVYQDLAAKFFEHFLYIARAMTNFKGEGINLWDEADEFYYDVLHIKDTFIPMKVRSMVGLIPLLAVETLEPGVLEQLPAFKERLEHLLETRPHLADLVSRWYEPNVGERRMLSLLRGHRMKCLLRRMLDESEFLSDYGVRALSRHHADNPYQFTVDGKVYEVRYQPAESDSGLFGGNSNWRGPIWFPVNYLIVESLQKFHHYYGDDFKIECPVGSGKMITIDEAANELTRRLSRLFLRNEQGERPVFGKQNKLQTDPHFKDYLLFYEYFHGDNGRGAGASHQTGWTGLIAKLLMPRS